MFRRLLLTAAAMLAARAAEPAASFARYLGAGNVDVIEALIATSDGGELLGGYTFSYGAGFADAWAVKLDAFGKIEWQTAVGGGANDTFFAALETRDGEFVCAGDSLSVDADSDALVVKFDAVGRVLWQRLLGGSLADTGRALIETADGGVLLVGSSASFGAGSDDAWIVKLSANGAIEWQRTYGGSGSDAGYGIAAAGADQFVVVGETGSFGDPDGDAWTFKIDGSGGLLWQKSIGGPNRDSANAIRAIKGGFILGAQTESFGAGGSDAWLIQLNGAGAVAWQKAYGGSGSDSLFGIAALSDRGLLAVGETSFGQSGPAGWILRVNRNGAIEWQRIYGGAGNESLYAAQELVDGRLIAAGYSDTYGTRVDALLLRLAAGGTIDSSCGTLESMSSAAVTNTNAAAADTAAASSASTAGAGTATFATDGTAVKLRSICGAPDLADLDGGFTAVEADGNRIEATLEVRNVGGKSGAASTVKLYFSKKPKLKTSVLVATESIGALKDGRSTARAVSGTKSSQHKYLIAVLDADEDLDEESEGNNLVIAPLPR